MIKCDYCSRPAELVTGRVLYPHRKDLHHKHFYYCEPCLAYVGCYPGSIKPLGRLANAELRMKKSQVHNVFDPIWKGKMKTRSEAYKWLSVAMNMNVRVCHIGMFDVDQCEQAIKLSKWYRGHDYT